VTGENVAKKTKIKSIGIVLDGNRRYAKEIMKSPWQGHKLGLQKSREALEWVCDAGIKYMTAYTLSIDNIKSRPKRELNFILKYIGMEADSIARNMDHIVHRYGIKVKFIGRTDILPPWLQKKIEKAETATKDYKNHFLNIAVAYGGQQEIVDATRTITERALEGKISLKQIDENLMRDCLYTGDQPHPDLIVRTGGEKRLSNFMSFQSAYSELVFLDKRWPEVTKSDFEKVFNDFDKRDRRFGK
jgi:tritrans,polycis-undecaprenyl-diphosphate synthase [geranylgeranyl-diphosphate specific]